MPDFTIIFIFMDGLLESLHDIIKWIEHVIKPRMEMEMEQNEMK